METAFVVFVVFIGAVIAAGVGIVSLILTKGGDFPPDAHG